MLRDRARARVPGSRLTSVNRIPRKLEPDPLLTRIERVVRLDRAPLNCRVHKCNKGAYRVVDGGSGRRLDITDLTDPLPPMAVPLCDDHYAKLEEWNAREEHTL